MGSRAQPLLRTTHCAQQPIRVGTLKNTQYSTNGQQDNPAFAQARKVRAHACTNPGTHAIKQAYTAAMSRTLQPCFTVFLVVCRRGLLINNAVVTKAASDTTCRLSLYGISE